MSIGAEVDKAIGAAVTFLAAVQHASGEIPALISTDPDLIANARPVPMVFPTALAAQALSSCTEARDVHAAACRFLVDEQGPRGLWRHPSRSAVNYSLLPTDVDDTSCASAAIEGTGHLIPNRNLLLDNRRSDGLFLTWVIPRMRWFGRVGVRSWGRSFSHLPKWAAFFREATAAVDDVDLVVNANCLFYLRDFDRREVVVDALLDVLRTGRETECDKWYDNHFVVLYLISRALRTAAVDARPLMAKRINHRAPHSPLERALDISVRFDWNLEITEDRVATLLGKQGNDGSWPRSSFYNGGRDRLRDGTLAAPRPVQYYWGSEALTTCFVLEALARWRKDAVA